MMYLGDYAEDATLDFVWSSNAADGASITRATNGTVSVYKANNATQSTAGVTDTEDFDSLTGIHHCRIDLSADAFYATGNDYAVVLSGATIDGKSVNAVLAHFSIQNRYTDKGGLATASALSTVAGYIDTEVAAILAAVDTEVAAIKAITDTLALSAIADALWDEALEGSYTGRQLMRGYAAALLNESDGGGTPELHFRDMADTKDRIVANIDENRNRTSVTLDLT